MNLNGKLKRSVCIYSLDKYLPSTYVPSAILSIGIWQQTRWRLIINHKAKINYRH